ncbi:ketopantoate reductase PanE/ApbA-domain-containing protein [Powellomyces hirtus]|nr:ketopantoate reductase PanE/ApbA-domain-containing protein [Powellomyces hirtus]
MSTTNILIVGAGAVGAFYASRLHQPQAKVLVSVVCRSNFVAVTASGFRMRTRAFGDYEFRPHGVYKSCEAAVQEGTYYDYVVVATKALPDIDDEPATIAPVVGRGTVVVLIQNGLGIEEPFRARFSENAILSAVTVISAAQTEPGVIVQHRWTRISIGVYKTPTDTPSSITAAEEGTRRLISIFHAGGIADAEHWDSDELQRVRWHKIAINATFNPSAVLSGGCGNAEMLSDPLLKAHCVACMEEVFAAAQRIFPDAPFPPPHLASIDAIVASSLRNTASKPSMLLDWEAGRPMELEVILGNPIRIAKRHGIDMPRLATMYATLRSMAIRRGLQKPREAKPSAKSSSSKESSL